MLAETNKSHKSKAVGVRVQCQRSALEQVDTCTQICRERERESEQVLADLNLFTLRHTGANSINIIIYEAQRIHQIYKSAYVSPLSNKKGITFKSVKLQKTERCAATLGSVHKDHLCSAF